MTRQLTSAADAGPLGGRGRSHRIAWLSIGYLAFPQELPDRAGLSKSARSTADAELGVVRWLASVGVNGVHRRQSYPVPLASAAEQLYLAGRRAGLGRHDDSTVIEVLRGAPLTPT